MAFILRSDGMQTYLLKSIIWSCRQSSRPSRASSSTGTGVFTIYTFGYYPSFQVWADEWDEELPVEEAVAGLQDFFRAYTEVTPEVKKTIAGYVGQRAVKGTFSEKYRVRLGMILWTVGEKWEAETGAV